MPSVPRIIVPTIENVQRYLGKYATVLKAKEQLRAAKALHPMVELLTKGPGGSLELRGIKSLSLTLLPPLNAAPNARLWEKRPITPKNAEEEGALQYDPRDLQAR